MQVPETPKPSEEELQDRLKMFVGSRRGFAYGSKNTHPKNLRFLDDFGMCSPVYEFRPEIRTKNKKWSRVDKAMFSPSRRMQRSYTIRLLAHPSRRSDLRCALSILRLSGKEHA